MTDTAAPYNMANDNAIMLLFLLNIVGISYVVLMNGPSIAEGLKSHFYYKRGSAPFKDSTHITKICNMLMYMQTIFFSGISATFFLMQNGTPVTHSTALLLTGSASLVMAALLLLKRVAYAIVNNTLFAPAESGEWLELFFFTSKILGFALAPAVVAMLFAPHSCANYVLYYIVLIAGIYLYIEVNGLIRIIFRKKRNYLDIFLYLCALEFLPIAMVLKFVQEMSDFITTKI